MLSASKQQSLKQPATKADNELQQQLAKLTPEIRESLRELLSTFDSQDASWQGSVAVIVDLDAFQDKPPIDIQAIENDFTSNNRTITNRISVTTNPAGVASSMQVIASKHYQHSDFQTRDELRMMLASRATAMHTPGELRNFVLVTDDPQFAPLASIIKSLSASTRVHGYCVKPREQTPVTFIQSFDSFRAYPDIVARMPDPELTKLRTKYAEALVHAILRLKERHSKPVGAALVPILRDRHPEISPQLLEFTNYEDLADFARDLKLVTKVKPHAAGDYELDLTDLGKIKAKALSEIILAQESKSGVVERIRSTVREILGTELPVLRQRVLIFNAAHWLLTEAANNEEGIALVKCSYAIVDHLGEAAGRQDTVYRLLNGLYRIGAFDYRPNAINKHDPEILRVRIKPQKMDEAFVLNVLHMQKRFPLLIESTAEDLATTFYGNPDNAEKITRMRHLIADTSFDRGNLPNELDKLDKI